jgi:hypothetical protein
MPIKVTHQSPISRHSQGAAGSRLDYFDKNGNRNLRKTDTIRAATTDLRFAG